MTATLKCLGVATWCLALAGCSSARPAPAPTITSATDAAATPAAAAQALVSGTVTYRELMALPPDAAIDVWIANTSPGINTMAIVAEATVPIQGRQVPVPFELRVDPARVVSTGSYGLKAVIRGGGQMLFANDAPVPVLTQGHPSLVTVLLTRVTQGAER